MKAANRQNAKFWRLAVHKSLLLEEKVAKIFDF
jgi:hypothetical protein